MGREVIKELGLQTRIDILKAAESVLTGEIVWWRLDEHPPIDEYGGELKSGLKRWVGII